MSFKLLENVIAEVNGSIQMIPMGTIISEVAIDFDQEEDQGQDTDKMLSIVQSWIDKFKPRRIVKAFGMAEFAGEKFRRAAERLFRHSTRALRLASISSPLRP